MRMKIIPKVRDASDNESCTLAGRYWSMSHGSKRGLLRGLISAFAVLGICACSGSGLGPQFSIRGDAGGTTALQRAGGSWMDPRARHTALLYVSDVYLGTVSVYSYPDLAPMGMLSGLSSPEGLCTDPKSGDIWVAQIFKSDIVNFAHGGTAPIRTLQDVQDAYVNSCAVNPKNGDLAATNQTIQGSDPGNLAIFKQGQGKPKIYSDRKIFTLDFAGYDAAGNLFLDATSYQRGSPFRLDELPYGTNGLTNVPWSGPQLRLPGGVQYDGTSLAVGNAKRHIVYQTDNGAVIGTTTLGGACTVYQFFIYRGKVIAPSICKSNGTVLIYDYPAGGAPVARITGFSAPYGVTISP
jgi:hypothetical protein